MLLQDLRESLEDRCRLAGNRPEGRCPVDQAAISPRRQCRVPEDGEKLDQPIRHRKVRMVEGSSSRVSNRRAAEYQG